MKIEKNNFYIITGGPGSGKSTIIDELINRDIICVSEVAREIIQEQVKIGGDALHTKDQIKFRDLMLAKSITTYEARSEDKNLVFFDRGIPELVGYCHLIGSNVPESLLLAVQAYRYNKKVFITPPWKEIYLHDAERKQSWNEAIETYQKVYDFYLQGGYHLVEVPKDTVDNRVNFILSQIDF